MNSLMLDEPTRTPNGSESTETRQDEIAGSVRSIVGKAYCDWDLAERRTRQRFPYPQLIHLTPVAADGKTPCGDTITVVGKQLSESGLDFFHFEPLPYRRIIASFKTPNGCWIGFMLDLCWCRFTGNGWYDNGGRFVQLVESPLAAGPAARIEHTNSPPPAVEDVETIP